MGRRRTRAKRQLLALGMLAVLLGLLELNRWLPGGWPGGGDEGGHRAWQEEGRDQERLRPPSGGVPAIPADGVTVALRIPGGGVPDAAEVSVDLPGAPSAPADARGEAVLHDPRLLESGFRVRAADGEVRHGPAKIEGHRPWTVHLPATPREPLPAEDGVEVTVSAAETGRAIEGAQVLVERGANGLETLTDAAGRAHFPTLASRARLRVSAAGRRPQVVWVHPAQPGPVDVALVPALDLRVSFVDAEDGSVVLPTRLVVRAPDGEVLWQRRPGGVTGPGDIDPAIDVRGALLEAHHDEYPVIQVPLAEFAREIRWPRGRLLEVQVLDPSSQRLPGGALRGRYVPPFLGRASLRPSEPVEVEVEGVEGKGRLVLPVNVPARLLVEASDSAPQVIQVAADEPAGLRKVRLDPGVIVKVRVLDADGLPIAAASVVAIAYAGGHPVRQDVKTSADGVASITALPPGAVELYAHAPGKAWAVVAEELEASGREVVLRLVPGNALRFVVEDALGLPLDGVRVHARPEDPGVPQDVVPPDAVPSRTGSEGTLVVPDLPDRAYRVRLSHPGFREVVLRDLRPGPGVHFVTLVPR